MIQLVERHVLNKNHKYYKEVDRLCFLSKNLYNAANYIIRQEFINNKNYLNYNKIQKLMQSKIDYKALPAKVSQQVLMLLDNNWSSFFKALKADEVVPREEGKASTTLQNNHQFLINESALPSSLNGSSTEAEPGKFLGRPKLPKYKDKIKGRNILVYTIQAISKPSLIKQQVVKLSQTNIEIRTVVNYSDLCQVRLVPKLNHYVIEVVYESKPKNLNLDKQNVVGIDLVLENLATITSNVKGFKPLIINGKPLKSVNQFFHKKKADLQSIVKKGTTKMIQKICTKRNLKVADYLHKASRQILNLLVANNIGTLVIGKNNSWKQEISLGKRNNQGFTQIPHDRFIHMLKYKSEMIGINIVVTEESYTSKASFLDLDPIPTYRKGISHTFSGKRIRRGMYKSKSGKLINADVNGAYNIIRKAIPNAFSNGIEGVVVHPVRLNLQIS